MTTRKRKLSTNGASLGLFDIKASSVVEMPTSAMVKTRGHLHE